MKDTMLAHFPKMNKREMKDKIMTFLHMVGIPDPNISYFKYPCDFSEGFIQRIAIALAIILNPNLIIADEPTTALGITIQAQILEVLQDIQHKLNTSMMFITHDFGVVSQKADNILVMYAGRCVEYSDKKSVLLKSYHPYTRGLIQSVPLIERDRSEPLTLIPGFPPNLANLEEGCLFYSRCNYHKPKCKRVRPELIEIEKDHSCACFFPLI
jgi:oligopeptide/dipeptide ABC transporter ATP-binding protein